MSGLKCTKLHPDLGVSKIRGRNIDPKILALLLQGLPIYGNSLTYELLTK